MPSEVNSRVSILVIDDNLHMRAIIKALLRAFHLSNVTEASDGAEGLDILNSNEFDLVIVDYSMPIFNGLEFVQMVRTSSDSKNAYIPIIMITGHSNRDLVNQARDAGVTEFMVKPVTAKSLFDRIVSIIDRPRAFVRSKSFFGPDRRRTRGKPYKGEMRRNSDNKEEKV
jgi:two-component system chemotaxis response regulator CheY